MKVPVSKTFLGLFFEPEADLRSSIVHYKQEVLAAYPKAMYGIHPPHLTFQVMRTTQVELCLQALRSVTEEWSPFTLQISGWRVFRGDVSTGGDTLAMEVQADRLLFELQLRLAESVANYLLPVPTNPRWTTAQAEAARRFGHPFVGRHWIPHFTIASLPVSAQLVDALTAIELPRYSDTVDQISVYRIDDDEHTLLHVLPFRSGTK